MNQKRPTLILALKGLTLTILTIFLVTACNLTQNSEVKGKPIEKIEPTPLNFIGFWKGEGRKEEMVKNITREYEFRNQEVSINLKFPEDIYFVREEVENNRKFVTDICKNPNPDWDIIMVNNDYANISKALNDPEWAKKYLVDFSTIPEFRNNTIPELLSDSVKNLWGGIIPGPFVEGVNFSLWFNQSVAEKVGIEIKQFDMTFDDLLSYIKAVSDYNKAHSSNIIPIYESKYWKTTPAIGQQLFASALDNPDELFSDTITENKLIAWHKTLKALEQLAPYRPFADRDKIETWDSGEMLANEECLFFSNGSWMYSIWLKTHEDKLHDFIPTEYPSFKTNKYYIGEYLIPWAVLKNSPHRDEAVAFLLAWNKSDVAQKWVEYTKSPTGIKGTFIESPFGTDKFETYTNHINKRYGANKYPLTISSKYILDSSKEYYPNYFEEVTRGELTADEAMRRIRASIQPK